MAELIPAPFRDLVMRLYREPDLQDALFELRHRHWYIPPAGGPDLSVRFHGRLAGSPLGPAAGPHTQMAQNILLSYVAGGRILELKTVQIDDRLTIGRPCIHMPNVGYNIEWSQELLVEQSLREYVAGAMLVHMFRFAHPRSDPRWQGPAGAVLYDLSVGYDLVGIRSDKVRSFLANMRDAQAQIEALRADIPREFAGARDLDYPARLSDSITLSTFHGCPADEIERICEFLIGEHDFDVIVKMNPPMLGQTRLEHLLHEVLGYEELTVNPTAYGSGLSFDEGVQLCRRLTGFAAARGRRFGAKFSNTLEVLNRGSFFPSDAKVMYLSGQPLHVITLTLADEFRRALGPDFPVSFSAGIDRANFPLVVACGFVPVTASNDLLRPGGYGRMGGCLERLAAEMRRLGAATIDEYIRRWSTAPGATGDTTRAAAGGLVALGTPQTTPRPSKAGAGEGWPARASDPHVPLEEGAVRAAALANLALVAELTRRDPRYAAAHNRKMPNRVHSTLETFDCLTCDKCLPVCPNAANFTYPTPPAAFAYHDLVITPDGAWRPGAARQFEITETMQIACYADFCNECGNCDTFCPEYGGPYIKKPTLFGSVESWQRAAPRDGFVTQRVGGRGWIKGRVRGHEYELAMDTSAGRHTLDDGAVCVAFRAEDHAVLEVKVRKLLPGEHVVSLWVYHTLRHLFEGIHDPRRINQVNAVTHGGFEPS